MVEPGRDQLGQVGDVHVGEHVGAATDRHVLAEPLGVVVAVGDEDRLVGAEVEPVQADRGDVGDHRVAVGHHRQDVAGGDRDMAGGRIPPGRVRDQVQDPAVAVLDGRGRAGDHLRVRLVDEAYAGDRQHGAHDVGAEGVDGGVVVVLRVALPGRRVEDGAALGRLEHRRRAQVQLRPSDPHQAVGVELQEPGDVPLHGGLAGHEDPVVGLGVVARHALLVALTVVDVDVQLAPVQQRLEVEHRVVAVEDDLGVGGGVELGQLGEVRGQRDRQLGPGRRAPRRSARHARRCPPDGAGRGARAPAATGSAGSCGSGRRRSRRGRRRGSPAKITSWSRASAAGPPPPPRPAPSGRPA